jgi:DNA-3-methyladenine glycosylase
MSTRGIKRLTRRFFSRPTLEVAPDLLGKYLVFDSPQGRLSGRIVEVEAYIGQDDPACHASSGRTARTDRLFGPPGHAYIYLIYGMYYCFNFVTEPDCTAAAVLLRAAEPCEGVDVMQLNSPRSREYRLLSGPGVLCRSFGLTREQNGWDLTKSAIWAEDRGEAVKSVATSPRIGISKATKRHWRFYDAASHAVSGSGNVNRTPKKVLS